MVLDVPIPKAIDLFHIVSAHAYIGHGSVFSR